MSDESVILINLLKVKPGKQDALIALLKQNTDTVVRTLHGWKTTRLIAAKDGAGVVIYSEWETPAAVEAMRSDPRMKAYFPKIIELASLDSIVGSAVLSETGENEHTSKFASHKQRRRTAMARMVVIYRTPKDVEAFDRHYFEIHVPLAKKIPGLRKYEVSDGPIATPLGSLRCSSDRNAVFRRPCGDRKGVRKPGGTSGCGGSPTFCA